MDNLGLPVPWHIHTQIAGTFLLFSACHFEKFEKMQKFIVLTFVLFGIIIAQLGEAAPAPENQKPGLNYQQNPDGSVSGSVGFSQAVNGPGANGAFGASQSFNFGPQGSSLSHSHSASLNGNFPGGNNFGFSQSNALSQSQGQQGFSSSGSNAASSQFSNPLFSSSQANANAFANQANFHNNNNNFNRFSHNPSFPQGPFGYHRRHRPGNDRH